MEDWERIAKMIQEAESAASKAFRQLESSGIIAKAAAESQEIDRFLKQTDMSSKVSLVQRAQFAALAALDSGVDTMAIDQLAKQISPNLEELLKSASIYKFVDSISFDNSKVSAEALRAFEAIEAERMKFREYAEAYWEKAGAQPLAEDETEAAEEEDSKPAAQAPSLLLQAVIVPGDHTPEGQLVEAVALPWFQIIKRIRQSPDLLYEIHWRKMEEIVAGAYREEGYEVVLTPRSNDGGRDVIATRPGFGSVRFVDQIKAYSPGHRVTADDVRAMLGVLSLDPGASKGLVTTTSDFAPGILQDPGLARFIPTRIELRNGAALLSWLLAIESGKKT